MSNPSGEESNLAVVQQLMRDAVAVMGEFPSNFVPVDTPMFEEEPPNARPLLAPPSMDSVLAQPEVQSWLHATIGSWPSSLMPTFLQASAIVSQVLEGFGAQSDGGMLEILQAGMTDPQAMNMLSALAQLKKETDTLEVNSEAENSDPMGMQKALLTELQRRGIALRVPISRTLVTLLGPDALIWLTAKSRDGYGKIQPHEFTRTGWHSLWSIENQLAIERELLDLPAEAQSYGKIVVALSWTLAALASHMPPALFVGESLPHLSSIREGQYTISVGRGTHSLVDFEPSAMRQLIDLLADGLANPMLSAADLMWIGVGLARVRRVQSGHGDALPNVEDRFSIFLSHRGRDSKLALAKLVQAMPAAHGVFLDCLVLPRGVVNRSFVFGSLARSERILIVETKNFSESAWCRKEAWFADALGARGLARVERLTLPQAEARIVAEGPESRRRRASRPLSYPIASRVLRDIDYWARQPNLHSLNEAGYPTEVLAPLQAVFENTPRPDDSVWVLSVGQAVRETLTRVAATAPDAEPFALWATALQYSLAAFGLTSDASSKMEVRRSVDLLNTVLSSIINARLHQDPTFQADAAGHLALIAAASAIQLAGFELDPRMTPALRFAMGESAGLRDGLLLLDVRQPGRWRTLRLHLLTTLVLGNLGGIGIVQNAADEVHQHKINDLSLEVLPCVTLYPGMESPFDFAPSN